MWAVSARRCSWILLFFRELNKKYPTGSKTWSAVVWVLRACVVLLNLALGCCASPCLSHERVQHTFVFAAYLRVCGFNPTCDIVQQYQLDEKRRIPNFTQTICVTAVYLSNSPSFPPLERFCPPLERFSCARISDGVATPPPVQTTADTSLILPTATSSSPSTARQRSSSSSSIAHSPRPTSSLLRTPWTPAP